MAFTAVLGGDDAQPGLLELGVTADEVEPTSGTYGGGTYGGGTYGDTGDTAAITTSTVARSVLIPTPVVTAVTPDAAVTPATVACVVTIPKPHMGGDVLGEDIIYLVAHHDPSIILVARRGTPKSASHTPLLTKHGGQRPSLSRSASANQPTP